MWYQSVSARSMPPARLASVGTIQAAAIAALIPAANQIATRLAAGAGGAAAAGARESSLAQARAQSAASAAEQSSIASSV